jgi:hypothetical protein
VDVPVVVNVISQNTPLSKQMLKSIRSSVEQIFSGPYIQGITNFEVNNPMKDNQPRQTLGKLKLRQTRRSPGMNESPSSPDFQEQMTLRVKPPPMIIKALKENEQLRTI